MMGCNKYKRVREMVQGSGFRVQGSWVHVFPDGVT